MMDFVITDLVVKVCIDVLKIASDEGPETSEYSTRIA